MPKKNTMDSKVNDKETTMRRKYSSNNTPSSLPQNNFLDSYFQDFQQQPCSPASSSTSQTTGDTTFEPSIDMMVNDFDDEQTLTEEEALAEIEAQDPADEIETLKKESEIPLEKLLAHYGEHIEQDSKKRRRKRIKTGKKHILMCSSKKSAKSCSNEIEASSSKSNDLMATAVQNSAVLPIIDEVIVIEESDDEVEFLKKEHIDANAGENNNSIQDNEFESQIENEEYDYDEDGQFDESGYENNSEDRSEHTKLTALALLYPDKYTNVQEKFDDGFSEDDDEEEDYFKKTIMVGAAYQAAIPNGLSKYGDVLPYENEDKLVWESSQVGEQEVEDFLVRVKEIKSSPSLLTQEDDIPSSSASVTSGSDQGSGSNTIKDDEQALHLLVQCGYNFKEALRRKRLNAVPLTGSMSLWSEEECRNFEEGIQKFGKDFRKIRQTQVRTRSIRELVQFYYLWKKTERRDQDFVDSDTIDHMDVYLDYDERDTGSNGGSKHSLSNVLPNDTYLTNQASPSKKHHFYNFSIMNETNRPSAGGNYNLKPVSKKSSSTKRQHRRRSKLLSGHKAKNHRHYSREGSIDYNKESNLQTSGKNCRSIFTQSSSTALVGQSLVIVNNASENHLTKK